MKTRYLFIIICCISLNLICIDLASQENKAETKRKTNDLKMFFSGGTNFNATFALKGGSSALDLDLGFGAFIFKFFAAGGNIDFVQVGDFVSTNFGLFGRFYLFKRSLIFGPGIHFDNEGNSTVRYELGTNLMITESIGYEPKFIYSPDDDSIILNLIAFSLYL